MKKSLSIFLVLFVSFFNYSLLNADCNDIKSEADMVERYLVNIDTKELKTVNINIGDLTQNLYIVVLNDFNDEVKTYHYGDSDNGMVSFDTIHVHESINYIVRVYSEDATCGIEPLKTITFKTSKFNPYSLNDVCQNSYDIEMCAPFFDIEDMSIEDFNKKVTEIVEELEKPFSKKVGEFIIKYWLYVFIPFVLIVMVYVIRIIILKRGKKND